MEPQGLAEGNSVDWGDNTLNALTAMAANVAGDTIAAAGDGAGEAAPDPAQGVQKSYPRDYSSSRGRPGRRNRSTTAVFLDSGTSRRRYDRNR